ncbi:MAG TPA: hypothetical protein DCE42_01535, partial [Myxococcales bacterium]|nr:hypothetical protein [Myxococcales bacterium]
MSFSTLFTDPQHHHTRVMRLLLLLTFVLLIPACSELYGYECEIDTDCPSLTFCDKGICQPIAQECKEKDYCDGLCVDLDRSDGHCGQCGHACSKESTCCHGKCVPIKKKECNGIDDDCDGYVDKGCPEHPCKKEEEGKTQRCAVSGQKGVCAQGLRTCTNGEWGICKADNVGAKQETCNGLDDDCDGLIDEDAKDCVRPFTRPILIQSPASETGLFRVKGIAADPLGVIYMIFEKQLFIQRLRTDLYLEKFADLGTEQSTPSDIHVSKSGYIYITESQLHIIRRIDTNGNVKTFAGTLGTPGEDDGDLQTATFDTPSAIAEDSQGNLYVVTNRGKLIRKIAFGAPTTVSRFVGRLGSAEATDGGKEKATFSRITHIALDTHDQLYVIDDETKLRKITQNGSVETLIHPSHKKHTDGPLHEATFGKLAGLAIDSSNNIYLSDNNVFGAIRKIDKKNNVTTLAGEKALIRKTPGFQDGDGTTTNITKRAVFSTLSDIALDGRNHLYVYDKGNRALRMLSLDENKVTTIVGSPQEEEEQKTTRNYKTQPFGPASMLVHSNVLYTTEPNSHYIRSYSLTKPFTSKVYAGTQIGDRDDKLSVSQMNMPYDIDVCLAGKRAGRLYVVDTQNSKIKEIDPTAGIISTLGGKTKGFQVGAVETAKYNAPTSVLCDPKGNLYISDTANHIIRVIDTQDMDSVFVGSPKSPGKKDGTRRQASFNQPRGLTFDRAGNILIADSGNHSIR